MRHWVLALTVGTLCAAFVGLSAALLLTYFETHIGEATAALPMLQRAAQARLAAEQAHTQALCRYDVRVERLGLETSTLGDAAGDRAETAKALSAGGVEQVWLALEARGALRWLGTSGRPPEAWPSREMLRRVQSEPSAWTAPETLILFACKRELAQGALWVIRALSMAQLASELLPAHDPSGLTWMDASGTAKGHEVLRVASLEGGDVQIMRVSVSPRQRTLPLGWVLGGMLFAGCVGGLTAYALRHRLTDDERVLGELERAAERVASGDLSSTISARLGGRADQTFRTFDRMTRELKEMRTRLAETERAAAFQDIARRIAHELKNPLSPMQVAIETLRKAHARKLPNWEEIFEESTRAVLDEVLRLQRIVREFEAFARLPKPNPGALSLRALVDDVVGLYGAPDVKLVVASSTESTQVRADREQITQVLVNLLQNAFDAARQVSAPEVRIELVQSDERVVLHVDDNGSGVNPADRERIFEPYVTTKTQGTGLGLAIVKRIVSEHGARIEVAESPLGGARFSVIFARIEGAHSASMP